MFKPKSNYKPKPKAKPKPNAKSKPNVKHKPNAKPKPKAKPKPNTKPKPNAKLKQGRTIVAWDSSGNPVDASIFGAFAMQEGTSPSIFVQLSDDRKC